MPSILFSTQFWLVAATNLCLFLIVSTLSFLPVIIVELGGDTVDVGLVMGSIGVTSLGSLPFVAPLIDRYGRKKFVTAGVLLMGLTNGGYLLFDAYSPLMIVVRLIQGLAFAACFNGCATAVVDLLPADRRVQGIGLFGVSGSLAVAVGPYIGETVLNGWGRTAYFVLLMVFGVMGFLTSLFLREPGLGLDRKAKSRGFFPTAAHDGHWATMTMAVIFGSAFAAMINFFPLHATNLGFRAGVFFVSYGLSLVLVRVLFGHLTDSFNRERVIFGCLMGFGILLACTSRIDSAGQTAFLGALFGLVQGLSYPTMMAHMIDRSSQQNRAVVVGLFTGSFGVGINVSVLAWGFIADMEGLAFMFLAGGVFMCAAAVLFAFPRGPRHAGSLRP
jgi:MFS family permease